MAVDGSKDFFISYNKAERGWAEWIAWQLQAEGYSVVLQAWDFRPGGNFVLQMDEAITQTKRTILLLSPNYLDLKAVYSHAEWAASFAKDPDGQKGILLPIRVRTCKPTGLLATITYIDLVDCDALDARNDLLAGIRQSSALPSIEPLFPGNVSSKLPATPTFPGSWPLIKNVPFRRNPYFTGREQLLQSVHEQLCATKTLALTQTLAIHGLGGIGKTQTAIEYAYRYQQHYQAIFWVRAAAVDTLCSDYVSIAELAHLEVNDNQDQIYILHTVKQWLSKQKDWLLILDNADNLDIIPDYLPEGENGHILLTTRDPAVQGIAPGIAIEQLDVQEGIELLLRRSRGLTPEMPLEHVSPQEQDSARRIVEALGGIPLAIDQAAAYIQQTKCGLARYLALYQQHRADLLNWGKGKRRVLPDYPHTVASTWGLAFEQVEQRNPVAAELLRLCAFLDPDAIPEDLLQKGASELGPVLQALLEDDFLFNEAIDVLLTFSLIRRLTDRNCLAIHRLVQIVIKDRLDKSTQQQWAEQVVRVVEAAFPNVAVETWELCQRYLPQVFACLDYLKLYDIQTEVAASLLYRAGWYLRDQGRYEEAEPLSEQALAISEKTLGAEHLETGARLNNLGMLYRAQGRYVEAERSYKRALDISEKILGGKHSEMGVQLNNLALLYRHQGRYIEAELLYEQALEISEKAWGADHPETGTKLNNLGILYRIQGRYLEAEAVLKRALEISEKAWGADHPETGANFGNLGMLYGAQGRYEEAEAMLKRGLEIKEKTQGVEHPSILASLNSLGMLYCAQGRYEEAEAALKRALDIGKKMQGSDHPETAVILQGLAYLYQQQGRNKEAELLYQRALAIYEKTLPEHHPWIVRILEHYASLLEQMQRPEEAAQLQTRAQAIRAKRQP